MKDKAAVFADGRYTVQVKAQVDQGQFEQVVINLAVNARDAMPTGGSLTIRTSNVSREEAERHGHELLPAGDYVLVVEAARELGGREAVRVPFRWGAANAARASGDHELGAVSVAVTR